MVTTNQSWEEETRKYMAEVQLELNAIDKQLEEIQAKKDSLTREVEAYEIALNSHLQRTGRQSVLNKDMRSLLEQQKNHEERLKRIAEHNNGVIKVGAAADILFNYHILKSKSRMNAYRIIYGLLVGMVEDGTFQKTSPGEFTLIGAQAELPA